MGLDRETVVDFDGVPAYTETDGLDLGFAGPREVDADGNVVVDEYGHRAGSPFVAYEDEELSSPPRSPRKGPLNDFLDLSSVR